jgi:hypothetical protein
VIVPRVIILVPSAQQTAQTLAQTVADGATKVRFTEVEVRAVSHNVRADGRQPRILERIEALRESDAVIVTTFAAPDADAPLRDVLARAEHDLPRDAFTNTVFGVIGANESEWLPLIARLGGIVISGPRGYETPSDQALALGERVATVVEWVRHVRSHEHWQAHQHSHHHHEHHTTELGDTTLNR